MKYSTALRRTILPALTMAFAAWLSPDASAEYNEAYYKAMDGKQKSELKAAAKSCVSAHTELYYYGLPGNWVYSDVYPELYDGQKRWWEMYSDQVYVIRAGESPNQSFSRNKMQREHSIPKSWWKQNGDVEYTPAYSDMWNLYPSDASANQKKSNYPFAEVTGTPTFDNGVTKVGGPKTGQGGGAAMVFEPADEYKGDFARTVFYMATVYDDLPWTYTYMFRKETYPTLRDWAMNLMLQWARKDPVSQKEIDRNNAVESQQGNRNPFIDFPELAEYIWGTRTLETFYIADQGGAPTPPITGDPELTAPVNGATLDFGRAAVGQTVTSYLQIEGQNFTQPLTVRVSGTDRAMFTPEANTISAAAINTSSEYLFPITFTPTSEGVKEARVLLYDGGLQGSVTVNLRGEGVPVPKLSTLTAYDATDVTATGYTANWSLAPAEEGVEYYILNRTRYLESGPESDEIQSDTNSYAVTDRDPAVMESYTVTSYALGYQSEPSNSIIVGATGVSTFDAELPLVIGVVDGGFGVISNPTGADITVYDTTGSVVRTVASPAEGELIELDGGIYIISSPAMMRPVKIAVW